MKRKGTIAPVIVRSEWKASAGMILPILLLLLGIVVIPQLSFYAVNMLGQIMCFALLALALNLVWGYCGVLSLGHGVFFGIGGYLMGMHLVRVAYSDTGVLPDFMQYMGWTDFPGYWNILGSLVPTLLVIVLVAVLFAFLFGFFSFRSKIHGVYFAIITQALTYALMLLFFRNDTGFGGNNGMTGFTTIAGFSLAQQSTQEWLAAVSAAVLFVSVLGVRFLLGTRLGKAFVAIRDDEPRLRFLGYQTLWIKLFAWCLSAALAAVAGALYVPQVGIVTPTILSPELSLEVAIWVAIGGRGSLMGPIVGAALITGVKFWLTAAAPDLWPFMLGGLTILVTIYLSGGVAGSLGQLRQAMSLKFSKPVTTGVKK